MTKREAVRECKELWAEIEERGGSKRSFFDSPDGTKWKDKDYEADCPLCHYVNYDCNECPLVTQYGKVCFSLGFKTFSPSDPKWFEYIRGLKA